MKHEHSKKLSGVWLDHQEALIVTTEDHKDHGEFAIREKVKSGHTGNPSRESNLHSGVNEHLHHYYKAVSDKLKEFDEILLMGPGKAHEELKNILHTDKHFSNKKIINESADHLSENQLVAKVKHHYQSKMHNS